MRILIGVVRFFLAWIIVAAFILTTSIGSILIPDFAKRRRFYSSVMSRYCRIGIAVLGFRLMVSGLEKVKAGSSLVVSNHVSYTDIFLISSLCPSLFITSVEVQRTFFLGAITTLGGSIFVERRSRTRLADDIDKTANAIQSGQRVVLFPEGTTGNGDVILPFKASLFAVAEKGDVAVQPVCIKYSRINGEKIDKTNRDRLYYYGEIEFFPHFFMLPFIGSVEVELTFLDPVPQGSGLSRKDISKLCRERINAVYSA